MAAVWTRLGASLSAQSSIDCGTRGLLAWSVALTVPVIALARALIPSSMSDDGMLYGSLAEDPLDNPLIVESPNPFYATFALRLLVPSMVWALPFDTATGFQILCITGLLVGAVLVSLLARHVGVGLLALVAGPTYVLSFHGIYGLWQPYHVDTVTLALFTGAVLAAYTSRAVLCSLLAVATVTSKEVGLALPLAWFAAKRGTKPLRRVVLETFAVGAAPLVVFAVMRYTQLIPHATWDAWEQYKLGFTTQGEWGYIRPLVQVFVQNFGLLWMLWPLALVVSPPRWRRFQLFVVLLIPFLAGGPWARSTGYLLPFVVPSALLLLSRLSVSRAAVGLAGSIAVAVPLSLRNIAMDEFASNLLLVPGTLVFLVAVWPAFYVLRRSRAPGRGVAVGAP